MKPWVGGSVKREICASSSGGGRFGGNRGGVYRTVAPELKASGIIGRASSGGKLRRSSGKSPPKARIAAFSLAISGSPMLEESISGAFFWAGFGAVGL